ncbi:NnrU domain-containing protein [Sphingomonas antarctica]|uniref:NnrU family protein n=1 Tax=Sphingomonas antarctica TaxID=2040274 RepID=UPI0039EA1DFE
MLNLILALAAFVGTHFAMSHPLRAPLVARLGAGGFLGLYSLVAALTLGWAAVAFRAAPYGDPLWAASDALWWVSTVVMLLAAILLVGSFFGNPALPGPQSTAPIPAARGVFAITRHPMMWSFALWSLAHALVSPRPAVLALSGAIAVLALVGANLQDGKKAGLHGERWRDWTGRTSFVPYGRGWAWPGLVASVGGVALWLVATWVHPLLGAPAAGIWRWLSA